MMNKDFASASHLHDVHRLVAANVTGVCDRWYSAVVVPPHTTTFLRPFFRDNPGEPVPEENFWTLWCKGRLTDTPIIRLGATPS